MIIRTAFAGAALAALTACAPSEMTAGPETDADRSAAAEAGGDCFNARAVNGYSEVDRDTIRVRVGQDRYYDVDVTATCYDLEWSQRLSIATRSGAFLCTGESFGDATVVTREDSCTVTNITRADPMPDEDMIDAES